MEKVSGLGPILIGWSGEGKQKNILFDLHVNLKHGKPVIGLLFCSVNSMDLIKIEREFVP